MCTATDRQCYKDGVPVYEPGKNISSTLGEGGLGGLRFINCVILITSLFVSS